MSRNAIIGIVVLLLVVGGWFLLRPQKQSSPEGQPVETAAPIESAAPSASEGATVMENKNMVSITASGFSPKEITIKVGESVSWENTDSANHTVNSAPHPTHTVYPPLNLGVIKPGEQKALSFPKAGTYKYHDHLNPSLTGSVTVQ